MSLVMKAAFPSLVFVLFAIPSPAASQETGAAHRLFTPDAITRSLSDLPVHQAQVDPRADWSRVQRLAASTEILLSARGLSARKCRFVAASETTLTAVDLEDAGRPTLQMARDDVIEIRRRTGRHVPLLGAVIGTAGGLMLGVGSAVTLSFKQCGGSCSDEKALRGLAIVGLPLAGGLAGYYLPKSGRMLTTIYVKP